MPPKVEKEAWNDDHTREVLRAIIRNTLSNRPNIYALPSLQGVSDNGGDRINKKVQQMLKKFCELYPGSQGMVEEEIKGLGRSKAKSGSNPPSPVKKNGSNGGTPKKRKVKDEQEE